MEVSLFVAILFLGLILLLSVGQRRYGRIAIHFACRAFGIELEVKGGS